MNHINKIIIVDDDFYFRNAFKEFIENDSRFKIIGEANNGKEFLELMKTEHPDIIIMDVFMPVMDGIDASKARLKQFPYEKIIALTTHIGPAYTKLLAEMGIKACVMKENLFTEIIPAINSVKNNGGFFCGKSTNITNYGN